MILFDIHHENAFFLRNAFPFCFPFAPFDNLYYRFSRLPFLFPMTLFFRSSVSLFFISGTRFCVFGTQDSCIYATISPFRFFTFPRYFARFLEMSSL